MSTIAQKLAYASEQLAPVSGELASLEARLLAQEAWGMTPELIVREAEAPLCEMKQAALDALVARRVTREPIAQILGRKHFWNDAFVVTRDVLTPRADSETIIEALLRHRKDTSAAYDVLDLGTGSGCLLLTVLGEYTQAKGVGVDASPAALNVAMANARTTGRDDRAEFFGGSWCETLETRHQFDIVISNPPYIATDAIRTLMSDVRDHEPRLALDGGKDGLDCYRAILAQVGWHMKPGALLLFEVGAGQADDVAMHGLAHGFAMVEIAKDLAGIDRVVVLEKPINATQEDNHA